MRNTGFTDKRTGDPTTATCLIMGHQLKNTGVSEGLFYEEQVPFTSNRRRVYFRGEMLYCTRTNCDFQQFIGSRAPIRFTMVDADGNETPLGADGKEVAHASACGM